MYVTDQPVAGDEEVPPVGDESTSVEEPELSVDVPPPPRAYEPVGHWTVAAVGMP
jgi:hypothetical protein